MTANNSKIEHLEKLESYNEICFPQREVGDSINHNQYFGAVNLAEAQHLEAEIQKQLVEQDEEDMQDQEFLEEFDNE